MSSLPALSFEDFIQAAPDVYASLLSLGKAVDASGLDKKLTELIKIRASQINHCAFCLQFHIQIARKLGIPSEKIDLVAVWQEAGIFSAREKAALAWTEALTSVPDGIPNDALYSAMSEHFTQSELVFLSVAISSINQWNRIGVALRFNPPGLTQVSA
ncbi:carboxymuconolactone decarboxylase family protein [Undibacterium sp. Ji67W]|uniref:carboxymuconolactone decarboxylase family protein n=1 Tax=Undibacterium sp. Ji67W TaxID=3413042 RepID=UPI003BF192C9